MRWWPPRPTYPIYRVVAWEDQAPPRPRQPVFIIHGTSEQDVALSGFLFCAGASTYFQDKGIEQYLWPRTTGFQGNIEAGRLVQDTLEIHIRKGAAVPDQGLYPLPAESNCPFDITVRSIAVTQVFDLPQSSKMTHQSMQDGQRPFFVAQDLS